MDSTKEYQVIAQLDWGSAKAVVAFLRDQGIELECETEPTWPERSFAIYDFDPKPTEPSTPLSIPVEQADLASKLLAEWRHRQGNRVKTLDSQIRKQAILGMGGAIVFGLLLRGVLGSFLGAVMCTLLVAFLILIVVFTKQSLDAKRWPDEEIDG